MCEARFQSVGAVPIGVTSTEHINTRGKNNVSNAH